MANEPDEVSPHSPTQPVATKPVEKAGVSASAHPTDAASAEGLASASTAGSVTEPPLGEALQTDVPGTADVSAAEGGTTPTEPSETGEPAATPDLSGQTEGGEWQDHSHSEEASSYYHEEEMYGQGDVTSGQEGTQSEGSGSTSAEDYYHHSEYDTGTVSEGAASPGEEQTSPESEPADSPLETDENGEEYGGPVKSFLEHLEDFRWVLIKSISAVLVAMVVCLVATPTVISLLAWPLRHPLGVDQGTNQVMRLHFGTNQWELSLTTNQLGALNTGTNRFVDFDLVPIMQGTNLVLAVQPTPEPGRSEPVPKVPTLTLLGPVEGFMIAIQVAIYGGIGLASPFLMVFIGQFLVPALKKREKQYLYYGVGIGAGLFVAGVAFCYFILMRVAVYATVQFASWMGFSSDIWRGGEYISFTAKFMVAMGLAFELPVLLLTLVKIGILDHHKLSKFRPYWVIVNLVLSGFITPSGDPFSMVLMALPIHILYEISYLIARYWAWRDRKREAAAAAQGD